MVLQLDLLEQPTVVLGAFAIAAGWTISAGRDAGWLWAGGRILRGTAALVVALRMATPVDEGATRGWPAGARTLWVILMAYGIAFGVLSLVGLIAGPHSGELWGRFERYAYRGIAVLLTLFVGARLLEAALGVPQDRTLWSVAGAAVIWCGLRKPPWFWNHPRAVWVRDFAGDGGATFLYVLLGALMVGIGLFSEWRFGRG